MEEKNIAMKRTTELTKKFCRNFLFSNGENVVAICAASLSRFVNDRPKQETWAEESVVKQWAEEAVEWM